MLLNCHTYFSYKYGTISIEQLLDDADGNGYNSLVLTDINNTSACIEFIRLCGDKKLKPVVGIDFRNGAQQMYIGIARNNDGFRELNEHLTHHLHNEKRFDQKAPTFPNAYVVYPLGGVEPQNMAENEFIGIRPTQVNRIAFSAVKRYINKLVILQTVTIRTKRDHNVHRLLRAIDNNTLLSKLPKTEEAQPDEVMLPVSQVLKTFNAYPQIIENTLKLVENSSIHFDFKVPKNKNVFSESGDKEDDFRLLCQKSKEGLAYRYPGIPPANVIARMEKELEIIHQMDFCSYFLINWDLVNHARKRGNFYVGRGSGANSMVAYLLRITDVDPVELDLYFERFINPSRKSPPDFDLDFASRDRDAITRYLFNQYGWKNTALVGTYITFQYRSMIRELGKVFGLPAHEIDKLQAMKSFEQLDDIQRLVIKYSKLIHDFPSHLSVHSSGIIISEKPISNYTATIMPPKGFPTIHFSMLEAEDLGFAKFDILGQRGLSKIEDTVHIVRENCGVEEDVHDIPKFKRDERVKQLLKKGKSIGCFYVESPAMRMLLTKLEADDYLRLVAASSIIRPGVAKSGMMREYILRYQQPALRKAAQNETPELYRLLEETYGVMVYQEDVIKVAHLFAGLTLAEADILRRGMSWKFKQRNEFAKIKDKFFQNCLDRKHPLYIVERVWTQIESFANYAFSKGHSASYAVESYQALYLKAYYPLEYMVATINNGGGFYRTEQYVHEARLHGGIILPPHINRSKLETIISGKQIYLGFGLMQHLELQTIETILKEREREGIFRNLQDFIHRTAISLEQLSILIRVGAFSFTGRSKKDLLWNAHFILSKSPRKTPERTLFRREVKEFVIPELYFHPLEDAYSEIEILGFPVSLSPFELLVPLKMPPRLVADDLPRKVGQKVEIVGYLVHVKRTRASNGKTMSFGTFVDLQGHWIDTVQFPPVEAKYPFRGPGCYFIRGVVMEEFHFISIETTELYRIPMESMDEPSTRLKKYDGKDSIGNGGIQLMFSKN